MITREQIIEKLKTVKDPEINLDIWTMGLIYEINIKNQSTVDILMTYTTPMCPFGSFLKKLTYNALSDLNFKKIHIKVTFSPAWKPSEELRSMLGI